MLTVVNLVVFLNTTQFFIEKDILFALWDICCCYFRVSSKNIEASFIFLARL